MIFLSAISLEPTTLELIIYLRISGDFAKLDILSLEDWFSDTFVFKETDPITKYFDLFMGSDNTIMVTNSGSFFGMQAIILLRVLILTVVGMVVGRFTRNKSSYISRTMRFYQGVGSILQAL